MQKRFGQKSYRVSLTAMFISFSLLFLYLASILPTMRITMYFLSSIFVMGLMVEQETGLAILMFVAVSLLSLLLMPDKMRVVPYVIFFGHYGIGKYHIEKIKDKVVAYVVKLIYFNAALFGIYFLARSVLLADITLEVPFWLIIVLAQVAFAVYDFLLSKVTQFYYNTIRKKLIR